MKNRVLTAVSIESVKFEINRDKEWLETTEGEEIECISLENLQAILTRQIGVPVKLIEDDLE